MAQTPSVWNGRRPTEFKPRKDPKEKRRTDKGNGDAGYREPYASRAHVHDWHDAVGWGIQQCQAAGADGRRCLATRRMDSRWGEPP